MKSLLYIIILRLGYFEFDTSFNVILKLRLPVVPNTCNGFTRTRRLFATPKRNGDIASTRNIVGIYIFTQL